MDGRKKRGKDGTIVEINWNDYIETFQEIFENAPKESGVENRGVQIVKFHDEDKKNKNDGIITIGKKTLVETAYI